MKSMIGGIPKQQDADCIVVIDDGFNIEGLDHDKRNLYGIKKYQQCIKMYIAFNMPLVKLKKYR
jgi:hypothetical protein